MKHRYDWLLALGLLGGPLACGNGKDDPGPTGSITIGSLLAYSVFPDFTYRIENGITLATEEINANGKVLGKDLEIIAGDYTSADDIDASAQSLIDQGVVAIIGPTSSPRVRQVAENVAVPQGIMMISPGATSPTLTALADNGLVFRTIPDDLVQARGLSQYAMEHGLDTASMITIETDYGTGMAASIRGAYEAAGGTIVAHATYPDNSAEEYVSYDFTPDLLEAIAPVTKPKMIMLTSTGYEGQKILDLAGQLPEFMSVSPRPRFAGGDGLYEDTILLSPILPEVVNGTFGTTPYAADATFAANFHARFDTDPDPFSGYSYDAAYLIAYGILASQSETSADIAATIVELTKTGTTVGVNDFAHGLTVLSEGGDLDYDGAGGALEMTAAGDVGSGSVLIWTIENEAFVDDEMIYF